jgi:hypothetical protein
MSGFPGAGYNAGGYAPPPQQQYAGYFPYVGPAPRGIYTHIKISLGFMD